MEPDWALFWKVVTQLAAFSGAAGLVIQGVRWWLERRDRLSLTTGRSYGDTIETTIGYRPPLRAAGLRAQVTVLEPDGVVLLAYKRELAPDYESDGLKIDLYIDAIAAETSVSLPLNNFRLDPPGLFQGLVRLARAGADRTPIERAKLRFEIFSTGTLKRVLKVDCWVSATDR